MIDTPDALTALATRDLAPLGSVRAAINLGNPILAQRDPGHRCVGRLYPSSWRGRWAKGSAWT
ncbi:MAG: hypothetical protein WDN69_32680 [Aliidongia sp.]